MSNFSKEAEKLGGTDLPDWKEYKLPDESSYCDKPDHHSRSIANRFEVTGSNFDFGVSNGVPSKRKVS